MSAPAPLRGHRVIDLSQYIAGPLCAQLLADFGAEVVKVEPAGGDPSRALPGTAHGSIYFRSYNTSKDSTVLDLRSDEGRAALDRMLESSSALVVNFDRRSLEALRLTWAEVHARHPHLVMAVVTGYGADQARGCMDSIAQCVSGYGLLNADEDGTPRVAAGYPTDILSGLYAAIGTAMALCDAQRSDGVLVDVAMLEVAIASLCGPDMLLAVDGQDVPHGAGSRDRAAAPCNVYRCRDGFCFVYAGLDKHWNRIRPLIDGPELGLDERLARARELDLLVESWTREHTVAEVARAMEERHIPAGVVVDIPEALRQLLALRPDAGAPRDHGGEPVPVLPVRFSGARTPRRAAPAIGAGAVPGGAR